MLSHQERADFKNWLEKNSNLQWKSISDTCSRLSRVARITAIRTDIPTDDFLFSLSKEREFSKLGKTIQSQLKKAYKLYREFHK